MTDLEQMREMVRMAADECEALAQVASPETVARRIAEVAVALREVAEDPRDHNFPDPGPYEESPLFAEWARKLVRKIMPSRERLREIARNPPDIEVD